VGRIGVTPTAARSAWKRTQTVPARVNGLTDEAVKLAGDWFDAVIATTP
jgi:hypothetical protein